MLHKLSLAAVAAIALGTAALAPTSASAWGHGGYHHHWGGGPRFGVWGGGPFWGRGYYPGSYYYGGYGGYGCRRWVPTPWGPRPRWVC